MSTNKSAKDSGSGTGPDGQGQTGAPSDEQTQFAVATLAEFGDSWKRPKNFSRDAEILAVTPERCEKHRIREMTAVESRDTVSVPPSEYDSLSEERLPFEERYDSAREEFLDETVKYVCEPTSVETCERCQGDASVACPNCTNGEMACRTCGGDGMEDCSQCRGWGSTGPKGRIACPDCSGSGTRGTGDSSRSCGSCNGDGHVMCNSCSGNAEHRCTNCGGGGIVTCGTCGGSTEITCPDCEGEREIVTAEKGSIQFSSTSEEKGVSSMEIPERYLTTPKGTKFKTDDEWTDVTAFDTETTVRREVERRHVDVTRIEYRYDDDKYELFDVEGSIRSSSYPKSGARSLVPYLLALALVALIGYGIYQYVL